MGQVQKGGKTISDIIRKIVTLYFTGPQISLELGNNWPTFKTDLLEIIPNFYDSLVKI